MNKKGDYGGFLLVLMFILLFTIIIFFVLCSKGTLSCEFCDDNFGLDIECEEEEFNPKDEICYEDGSCYELKQECLSEIIYYVPYNYTGKFNIEINSHEGCYDTDKDPLGYGEKVKTLFEEHPDDWNEYLDTLPDYDKDPIVSIVETDTDIIYYENVYGYVRDE